MVSDLIRLLCFGSKSGSVYARLWWPLVVAVGKTVDMLLVVLPLRLMCRCCISGGLLWL